jgi:hypothetical protein
VVVVLEAEAENLLAAVTRAARSARRAIEEAPAGAARGVFVADCVSRTDALGSRYPEELVRIHQELNGSEHGTPIAGALTLGEIASRGQRFVDFYNKTVVVGVR